MLGNLPHFSMKGISFSLRFETNITEHCSGEGKSADETNCRAREMRKYVHGIKGVGINWSHIPTSTDREEAK